MPRGRWRRIPTKTTFVLAMAAFAIPGVSLDVPPHAAPNPSRTFKPFQHQDTVA